MKSIILYPEYDRYVLKRIFKIFRSQELNADACPINLNWTQEELSALYAVLNNYSHIIVILSSENSNEQWFTGLLGYLSGSNKESYFYFTENDGRINSVINKFNNGQGYDEVKIYAEAESARWNNLQKKENAKSKLIEKGFALSSDSMGECVASGLLDIVKNFVDAGFKGSTRDSKGVPMLCLAIRKNRIEIVKFLISIGADINAISEDRHNTPIMDAASTGHLDLVKLLVKEDANLECQSKNGQTALILAVGNGDEDVSNYLLSVGADYEIKDQLGMSAKKYASLFKKESILINMK